MAQVTLAHLLAKAMEVEFANMIRADDPSDWMEAAQGILDKICMAMEQPKSHPYDYTPAEVNLIDMHLQIAGWDPEKESRAKFVNRYFDARSPDLPR